MPDRKAKSPDEKYMLTPVAPGPWEYLSGARTADLNGAAASVTVPSGADAMLIVAEGGALRFALNATATASSPGYVPEDTGQEIGPLSNLTSLSVYGAAGTYANVLFFRSLRKYDS